MLKNFKPRLIAADIDGTLLNSDGELTPRTRAAISRALELGVKVVTATGRMYSSAAPVARRLGITSPCVFFNGAMVRDPRGGEIIFQRPLDERLTSEILSFFRENNWYVQLYHGDKLYVKDDGDERCKYYEKTSRVKAVPLGENFWSFRGASFKMLGMDFESGAYKLMLEKTAEKFGDRLYTAASLDSFMEMVHPLVNKARALESVAAGLGIKSGEVLAFGDGANDREMLEWAGVGVAMGNARGPVRESADLIAPDNDSDGVAVIIEKFLECGVL